MGFVYNLHELDNFENYEQEDKEAVAESIEQEVTALLDLLNPEQVQELKARLYSGRFDGTSYWKGTDQYSSASEVVGRVYSYTRGPCGCFLGHTVNVLGLNDSVNMEEAEDKILGMLTKAGLKEATTLSPLSSRETYLMTESFVIGIRPGATPENNRRLKLLDEIITRYIAQAKKEQDADTPLV